jgi:hypothetical protein
VATWSCSRLSRSRKLNGNLCGHHDRGSEILQSNIPVTVQWLPIEEVSVHPPVPFSAGKFQIHSRLSSRNYGPGIPLSR